MYLLSLLQPELNCYFVKDVRNTPITKAARKSFEKSLDPIGKQLKQLVALNKNDEIQVKRVNDDKILKMIPHVLLERDGLESINNNKTEELETKKSQPRQNVIKGTPHPVHTLKRPFRKNKVNYKDINTNSKSQNTTLKIIDIKSELKRHNITKELYVKILKDYPASAPSKKTRGSRKNVSFNDSIEYFPNKNEISKEKTSKIINNEVIPLEDESDLEIQKEKNKTSTKSKNIEENDKRNNDVIPLEEDSDLESNNEENKTFTKSKTVEEDDLTANEEKSSTKKRKRFSILSSACKRPSMKRFKKRNNVDSDSSSENGAIAESGEENNLNSKINVESEKVNNDTSDGVILSDEKDDLEDIVGEINLNLDKNPDNSTDTDDFGNDNVSQDVINIECKNSKVANQEEARTTANEVLIASDSDETTISENDQNFEEDQCEATVSDKDKKNIQPNEAENNEENIEISDEDNFTNITKMTDIIHISDESLSSDEINSKDKSEPSISDQVEETATNEDEEIKTNGQSSKELSPTSKDCDCAEESTEAESTPKKKLSTSPEESSTDPAEKNKNIEGEFLEENSKGKSKRSTSKRRLSSSFEDKSSNQVVEDESPEEKPKNISKCAIKKRKLSLSSDETTSDLEEATKNVESESESELMESTLDQSKVTTNFESKSVEENSSKSSDEVEEKDKDGGEVQMNPEDSSQKATPTKDVTAAAELTTDQTEETLRDDEIRDVMDKNLDIVPDEINKIIKKYIKDDLEKDQDDAVNNDSQTVEKISDKQKCFECMTPEEYLEATHKESNVEGLNNKSSDGCQFVCDIHMKNSDEKNKCNTESKAECDKNDEIIESNKTVIIHTNICLTEGTNTPCDEVS